MMPRADYDLAEEELRKAAAVLGRLDVRDMDVLTEGRCRIASLEVEIPRMPTETRVYEEMVRTLAELAMRVQGYMSVACLPEHGAVIHLQVSRRLEPEECPQAPSGEVYCRICGTPVEEPRRCYATPTCYACLPEPEPEPLPKVPLCGAVCAEEPGWVCSRAAGHQGRHEGGGGDWWGEAEEDLPFCACGRRVSECDGSRLGCRAPKAGA